MNIGAKSTHTTPAGGNVFADLGFEPAEAAALKAESQRIIFEKLAAEQTALVGKVERSDTQHSR